MEVVECAFDEDELAFYKAIEKKVEVTINKYVKTGSMMQNYTCVMVLLLRLRQGEDTHFLSQIVCTDANRTLFLLII